MAVSDSRYHRDQMHRKQFFGEEFPRADIIVSQLCLLFTQLHSVLHLSAVILSLVDVFCGIMLIRMTSDRSDHRQAIVSHIKTTADRTERAGSDAVIPHSSNWCHGNFHQSWNETFTGSNLPGAVSKEGSVHNFVLFTTPQFTQFHKMRTWRQVWNR